MLVLSNQHPTDEDIQSILKKTNIRDDRTYFSSSINNMFPDRAVCFFYSKSKRLPKGAQYNDSFSFKTLLRL